ncbi:MAG: hypothetical protein B6I20_13425 [Bacteroidetes bacterium 4572_117]|nr:MAG: hypothetical protein B6I20_13425 [Bacteroidetes bacterium 4572_117]
MKTKLIITTVLIICILSTLSAQEIRSGKKSIKFNNAPELVIKNIKLVDENKDQIVDAEENCFIKLTVQNTGKSPAKTVNLETKIIGGITDALSFEKSIHVGNIAIGEKKEVQIPFSAGISLKNGVVSIQFIALETNNYDSKPTDFELKVQAKQVPLAVNWYYPVMPTTTVNEASYTIKACILSSKPVSKVSLYVNNQIVTDSRAFKLIKTNTCDYYLAQKINLQKGKNTIKIVAINSKTIVTSEIRTINYTEVAYEQRLALIIGNSEYKTAPLRNPENDAKSMANALRDLNFEVIEIINGNKEAMRKGIRDFYTQLKENRGVGLFYYAGHGIQVKGENFLVPINHDINEEYEVPDRTIRVNSVLTAMEGAGTRMNIVILDACRDNPYARSMRSGSRGLAQIYAEGSGSIIAYATAPGSTASDGAGKNGLYTQELLKAIKTPGLEIGMVFRRVLTNVKKQSSGKQLPWTNSSIEGEFYFVK